MTDTSMPLPKRRGPRIAMLAAGLASVAAGALLVAGGSATAESTNPDTRAEQPEYPLPDLPPLGEGERYRLLYHAIDGKDSKLAEQYGAALWDWVAETDVEVAEKAAGQVFDGEIFRFNASGDGESTGESIPLYSLGAVSAGGDLFGPPTFLAPDRDITEILNMEIRPRSSFKEGPGETFEYLADCTDRADVENPSTTIDVTCTETTSPRGEPLLLVETVRSAKATGEVYSKETAAVLYRADGIAVKVTDSLPDGWHSEGPIDPDLDPYFGTDQLSELALSMPDAIVEG